MWRIVRGQRKVQKFLSANVFAVSCAMATEFFISPPGGINDIGPDTRKHASSVSHTYANSVYVQYLWECG